ncbi:MAG: hypothetical protein ACQEV6_05460 [Pseudomonadota bacterium]
MTLPLRVLLACPPTGNPYVSELVRSLNERPGVQCVQSHREFLEANPLNYDVVHFQWPEAILGWNAPWTERDLQRLNERLAECRVKGIKLVGTVHNESPHVQANQLFSRLYESVYLNLDAFVHLGQTSVEITKASRQTPGTQKHCVIPHGNYDIFRTLKADAANGFSRRQRFTVLCFGAVRKPAEVNLICRVADSLSTIGGDVVIAGRVYSGSRRKLKYYQMKMPLFARRNIRLISGKIPDERVAAVVSESDALLIPRVDTLNSGNVALGFTFGKIVLGPDIGVIGEELKRRGNPVFDPADKTSIKAAVLEARQLAETSSLGADNRHYAETDLAWGNVAVLHENLYRSLQPSAP